MLVALVYFISWTPWFVINIVALFNVNFFNSNFFFMRLLTHLVGFLNSASNPVIYYFMSEKFRLGFRRIIGAVIQCHCSRRHLSLDAVRSQNNYSTITSNRFHTVNATCYNRKHVKDYSVTRNVITNNALEGPPCPTKSPLFDGSEPHLNCAADDSKPRASPER